MKSIKPNITLRELNEFERKAKRNLKRAFWLSLTGCILCVLLAVKFALWIDANPYICLGFLIFVCTTILVILNRLERNEQITKKAKIKE